MKKIVILISHEGTGSNLQAIITAIQNKKLQAKIIQVIADAKNAKGLQIAELHHISTKISENKKDLLELLRENSPDFIVLTGWKQIISDEVLALFPKRILNLHPGLIPDNTSTVVQNPDGTDALWNKGKYSLFAIEEFFKSHATYAGSSVHFLTNEFDFGPVLGRTFVKIKTSDTIDSLYRKLKKKENTLYVAVLQKLCN